MMAQGRNGAISEGEQQAEAVKQLLDQDEAWPEDGYHGRCFDWLRLTNAWTAVALGFVEVVLSLRLGFRLAGANEANGFVALVYDTSGVLIAPFRGIVEVTKVGSAGFFEPSTLIAMLVYVVAAVLLMSLAWALDATFEDVETSRLPEWARSSRS